LQYANVLTHHRGQRFGTGRDTVAELIRPYDVDREEALVVGGTLVMRSTPNSLRHSPGRTSDAGDSIARSQSVRRSFAYNKARMERNRATSE
jgi:hypothetical protein